MTDIRYIQSTERQVGEGHAILDDTLNRPLRDVLTASGLDPDAAFTGFVARSATDEFYVESYRLNGAVSDTVAFQAALTAAKANGRGAVVLGARDYSITGVSLTSATDITIRGQGRKATKVSMSGTTNGALLTLTLCERFHITGIWFHGNNVGTTDGTSGAAIYWDLTGATADMEGFVLDHCTFDNFKGATWVRVQNTTAYTCAKGWWHHNVCFGGSDQDPATIGTASAMLGLRLPSGTGHITDWWIEDNYCEASTVKQGISAIGTGTGKFKRITYRNNTVVNAGLTNSATVEGAYGLILYGPSEDCDIIGNKSLDAVTVGIYTNLTVRCRVVGNTCTGTLETDDATLARAGIAMTDPAEMTVTDNTLYNNALAGISVSVGTANTTAGTISDNTITGGQFGIILRPGGSNSNVIGLSVADNSITGTSDYAILTRRASGAGELGDTTIVGNTIGYPNTAQLRIGSNDKRVANTAVFYTLSGVRYRVAADSVGTALAAGTIPIDQFGIYLFSADTSATPVITCTAGAANFTTGYASSALALAALPATPANQFSLGYVIVQTKGGTTFVGGTDSLTGGASGNVALSTTYGGFTGTAGLGIGSSIAGQTLRNVRIAQNIIHVTGTIAVGIDCTGSTADAVVVENNIIDGGTTYGLSLNGGTWTNGRVLHNIVKNAGTNADATKGCYRITTTYVGDLYGNIGVPVSGGTVCVTSSFPIHNMSRSVTNAASPYTVVQGDQTLFVDCTAGAVTVTFPLAASFPGRRLTVVKTDSSANVVTIARSGSDTLNNQTSATVTNRYQQATLESNGGSAWFYVNSGITSTTGDVQVPARITFPATAAGKIVGGSTSLSLRNNADNADNLIITDAGAATHRTTVTATRSIGSGTALVAGDVALSAGWGNTATVSAIAARDTGGRISITCNGAGVGANPTATITFKDGTWGTAPAMVGTRGDGQAPTTAYWALGTASATAPAFTFVGTPVAGTVYVLDFLAKGK